MAATAEAKGPAKDQSVELQNEQVEESKESGGRPRETPATPDGGPTVIKMDGGGSVKTESGDAVEYVTVSGDVWGEFIPVGAQRPSHVLLFHAGQVVSKAALDAATSGTQQ